MKLSKFLFLVFLVTFIALVYVYQQTEIFYLAYLGEKKQTLVSELLDKNKIFRYNINRFSSLPYLDKGVLQNVDFELPAAHQLVRLQFSEVNTKIGREPKKRANLFFSFFSRIAQAQAQSLNRQ